MSALPSGWLRETLSTVAEIGSGGTPSAKTPSYYGGATNWAVIGDLRDGPVATTARTITDEGLANSSAKIVPAGTILLGMYGSIGKLGLTSNPMATNQAIATIRPRCMINRKYLFWYLFNQREKLINLGKGAAQQNISQTVLKPWPIDFPYSSHEQRRIVDLLENHLSRLDAADGLVSRAARTTKSMRSRILSYELSVLENTQSLPLAQLVSGPLANGRSVPTRIGGFPVLRLTSLRDGKIDLSERKAGAWTADDAARFLVRRGDFLISRGNGSLNLVGRAGLVTEEPEPVAYPDTLIRARPNTAVVSPSYLSLAWTLPTVRRQIESSARTTAGIYKVNQKDLSSIAVPVPSLQDQIRISNSTSESDVAIRRLEASLASLRARSRALRRSLLAAAFSGRLTSRTDLSGLGDTIDP